MTSAPPDDRSPDDASAEADAPQPRIAELRLVIEASDLKAALAFYRDALGLPLREGYANGDAAQLVLDAGRASIELIHPELPEVEADTGAPTELVSPPAPRLRLSFRSKDLADTIAALDGAGAERVVDPKLTSIGSISARFVGPDRMPITVYEKLSGPDFAEEPRPAD